MIFLRLPRMAPLLQVQQQMLTFLWLVAVEVAVKILVVAAVLAV